MNNPEPAVERAATADTGRVPITLACALYDRMQALYTGEVEPEGIDLTFRVEDFPRRLFDSAMALFFLRLPFLLAVLRHRENHGFGG